MASTKAVQQNKTKQNKKSRTSSNACLIAIATVFFRFFNVVHLNNTLQILKSEGWKELRLSSSCETWTWNLNEKKNYEEELNVDGINFYSSFLSIFINYKI